MLFKNCIVVIAFVCLTNGQGTQADKSRYDNFRLYSVRMKTKDDVKLFQEIYDRNNRFRNDYPIIGRPIRQNQDVNVLVAAHKIADFTDILNSNEMEHEIMNYNFQANIDAEAKNIKPVNTPAREFDWRHYYHLETIYAWLEHLCEKYSGIVTPLEVGSSYEGIPIIGVKLSHKENNTAIFIEGGIHAREWISPATATFILDKLLTSTEKVVQDIAQNFDWIFFPVINPDGYKATFEKDRLWRKTRKPFGVCRGTDLNRNFNIAWNKEGSSPDSCHFNYAGPTVNSEPESEQLTKYLESIVKPQRIQTYVSFHSYSQYLMFPYAYTSDKADNYDDLKAIGEKTVEAIKSRYGTVYQTESYYKILYPSSGTTLDFAYDHLKIPIVYTFELRGPSNYSNTDGFILPAEQIEPVGWEILDGLVALLKEAKVRGYYDDEKIIKSKNLSP